MAGLDIDGPDVVVDVGRGNIAQTMGRLCRFSREEGRHLHGDNATRTGVNGALVCRVERH